MRTAICPGSYNPPTIGHIDIIVRAAKMFDRVIAAVLINPEKASIFTIPERVELLRDALLHVPNAEVMQFSGYLSDFAREQRAPYIVKGVRDEKDMPYEFEMAHINRRQNAEAETIFLPAYGDNTAISSSRLKKMFREGEDIRKFLPAATCERVLDRLRTIM